MGWRWRIKKKVNPILRSVTGEYLTLEKRLVPEYDQAIERLGGV
jgi:hypothetical protein